MTSTGRWRHRRMSSATGLLLAAALATGCGTTVPGTADQRAVAGPDSGSGLGAPAVASPGTVSGPGGSEPFPSTAAQLPPGSTDTAGSPGSTAGGSGPGVTPVTARSGAAPKGGGAATTVRDTTPIKIGILYLSGGNEVISAGFGSTPVSFGDGKLEAQAVVDDINRNGGVGGRKIEPSYAEVQAANANGPGLEAACRKLTEDNKVSVIMSMFNVRSQLVACAKKAGALLLDVALGAGDDDLYREFADTLFTPTQLNLDSEQRLVIRTAEESGALKGAKVGVLIQQDDETFQRVYDSTISPELRRRGVPHQSSTIATGTATNDISAAVLRFKADGVNLVMFSAGNGGIPEVLFMQAAEQQAFRPRYAMGDSTNTWFVGGSAPRAQAEKIFGAGTYPIANVDVSQYPTTPREKHCLDVIREAGEDLDNRHSSLTATFYCEMLYGFDAVGETVTGRLDKVSYRAAYQRMGTTYPAITTFAANLSNGRNDNPSVYRVLGWKAACSCISYLSPQRPLPF